jgi:hypothetical protein
MADMHECIELSALAGFVIPQAITRGDLGAVLANLGDLERGEAVAREGLEVAETHNAMAVPLVTGSLGEIQLLAGDVDGAEATIGNSNIERLPGPIHFAASAHVELLRGRIASLRGDHAGAIAMADAVIEWLGRLGVQPFLPAARYLKGTALLANGVVDEAEAVLLDASSDAQRLGFAIAWRIDAALAGIAAERGDETRAAKLRTEATATIDRVAASLEDEELRASFLNLPDVGAVRSS